MEVIKKAGLPHAPRHAKSTSTSSSCQADEDSAVGWMEVQPETDASAHRALHGLPGTSLSSDDGSHQHDESHNSPAPT